MTIKRKGNRTEEEGGRCRAAERHETFDCVPAPGRVQGADDEEGGGEQVYVFASGRRWGRWASCSASRTGRLGGLVRFVFAVEVLLPLLKPKGCRGPGINRAAVISCNLSYFSISVQPALFFKKLTLFHV
jgi:hypothetical protein